MALCACSEDIRLPDYTHIPSVVFSSPHVASVGLDEDGAVDKYKDVNIYSTTFRCVAMQLLNHFVCMQ